MIVVLLGQTVTPGLDPGVHRPKLMDGRVNPGHDS
jgi:hypothetical protein